MPYKDPERQREYQANRLLYLRNEWINSNGPCVKCRTWKNLEVDHVDPSTKVSHNVWSWSPDRRKEELSKCQVLCVECHKEKTAKHYFSNLNHGTQGMYRHGCRCIDCKSRYSVINKEKKKKLRHPPLV